MNKSKDICWIVSNCFHEWSGRKELANELTRLFPTKLHIWGSAFGKCLIKGAQLNTVDHGHFPGHYYEIYEPQQEKIRGCKFYFAFGNSNCSDYMTEKYFNALEAGAIPIVNGWRSSYQDQLPGSFIHVSDFESLQGLADYLKHLLGNEETRLKYHAWRVKYSLERAEYQPISYLCTKLMEHRQKARGGDFVKPSIIRDLKSSMVTFQNCTRKKNLNIHGDNLIRWQNKDLPRSTH